MFLLSAPDIKTVQRFIAARENEPFSYNTIGATDGEIPADYVIDHNRQLLGSGPETFERAIAAIRGWKMFAFPWVEIVSADTPIEVGRTVAIAVRHFATRGVQAEIVHLNGAMELAPSMGLSRLIVDLVQSGSTLKANGLRESEVIAHVTSRLIVNRTALKTRPEAIGAWIARFRTALAGRDAR